MKKMLGPLETRLMAYAQMRRLRVIRLGELAEPLGFSDRQERSILSRLSVAGMIVRVRRGLYLIPPRLPLGGLWSPDDILALNVLMEDKQGRYQICGPNAFNRYGLDEQAPARLYAYNNRLSGDRTIGAVAMTLIKVADNRLGGTESFKTAQGQRAVYSSCVRTLVDAIYDWSRFSSLPRGYEWIRKELTAQRVSAADLIRTAIRYGNQRTLRRIGLLLERENVAEELLLRIEKKVKPSTSLIPWIPVNARRGRTFRRWGVILNEQ
jgi:predicted transcriptional regulator of viral defense system